MTAGVATASRLELDIDAGTDRTPGTSLTVVIVFDGVKWVALCRELDIASQGDSEPEAWARVRGAIREALQVAGEHGVAAGKPVPDRDLLTFMRSHQGPGAVLIRPMAR